MVNTKTCLTVLPVSFGLGLSPEKSTLLKKFVSWWKDGGRKRRKDSPGIVYVIPENELSQISHLNTMATVFFSVGTALISFCVGIWVDASFQTPPLPPVAEALKVVVSPIIGALGLLCYAGGVWQLCAKHSMLNTIKSESTELKKD